MTTKAPINLLLDSADWKELQHESLPADGTLYATHEGVLDLFGHKLRCFRLNDGTAVFEQNDFIAFFNGAESAEAIDVGTPQPWQENDGG